MILTQLATNALEMHELLHEILDEFDEAVSQGAVLTDGLHRVHRKIPTLLKEINVERTNPPCK